MMQDALKLYTKRYGLMEPTQAERLCEVLEASTTVQCIPQRAYILATIAHETQHLFLTTVAKNKYGKRGFIQIKGRDMYKKFGLEKTPEQLEDPRVATLVATLGMLEGLFTGRSLEEFVNESSQDFVEARLCVDAQTIPRLSKQVSREIEFWRAIAEELS